MAKNKKFNWFKRSNKFMFSWKKSKKLLKMMLLSPFIERIFYSWEDIVCTCDSLADPRRIETVDNGIIYVSTINQAWRGFKSLNLRDTLTLPGATQSDNYLLALNLFEMIFFTDWLILISKDWNLFVRFCGTITNSRLFFAHNRFISLLSWPLKVSIIIKERWSSG